MPLASQRSDTDSNIYLQRRQENRHDLEQVQKAALKVILMSEYDNYENALKLAGLQSLVDRRDAISLKFAKKLPQK